MDTCLFYTTTHHAIGKNIEETYRNIEETYRNKKKLRNIEER